MTSVDPTSLVGRWWLTRRLADRRTSSAGTFVGELSLTVEGDSMRWRETGELVWGGHRVSAQREYRLIDSPDGWWVHFADGRPFHPWTPGAPVEHVCVADTYRGLVRIDGPDAWRIGWRVLGPSKDQRIVSRLSRCREAL